VPIIIGNDLQAETDAIKSYNEASVRHRVGRRGTRELLENNLTTKKATSTGTSHSAIRLPDDDRQLLVTQTKRNETRIPTRAAPISKISSECRRHWGCFAWRARRRPAASDQLHLDLVRLGGHIRQRDGSPVLSVDASVCQEGETELGRVQSGVTRERVRIEDVAARVAGRSAASLNPRTKSGGIPKLQRHEVEDGVARPYLQSPV